MPTIQPFHHRKKKQKLTLELDFELAETLKGYASYYKEAFGADVNQAELLVEFARQFSASDGEFQRYRGKVSKGASGATVAS